MPQFRHEQSRSDPKFLVSVVTSRWLSRRDGNWRVNGDNHGSHCDLFKEQRRHVNQFISSTKSTYYTAKITEAASDHKQLYNVVNALLIKPEASLPNEGSLEQLASRFSAFFQDKVRLIQENMTLKADPNYVPPDESPGTVDDKLFLACNGRRGETTGQQESLKVMCTWSCANLVSEGTFRPSSTKHYKHCQLVHVNRNCADENESCTCDAFVQEAFFGQRCHENFRTVSNLTSKLTERVVLNRLIDHV